MILFWSTNAKLERQINYSSIKLKEINVSLRSTGKMKERDGERKKGTEVERKRKKRRYKKKKERKVKRERLMDWKRRKEGIRKRK